MERLLLSTQNPGKIHEFKRLFSLLGIPTALQSGYWETEERGDSFATIAVQKARATAEHFGIPALADDGGLEIDVLLGEPGIFSRRWPGYAADDETLIALALKKLQGVPDEQRGAQFRTAVAIAEPNGRAWVQEGILRGRIAQKAHLKREAGYPFRSLFIVPEFNRYAVELTDEELLALSHRKTALEKLIRTVPFLRYVSVS